VNRHINTVKMNFDEEVYITSRSRTPSLIDVTSQNGRVFKQLPDLIQEAIVGTDCMLPHSSFIMSADRCSFKSEAANKSSSK
jgi:sensor domain CHASE-containing protein